jgi:hypothetical protein
MFPRMPASSENRNELMVEKLEDLRNSGEVPMMRVGKVRFRRQQISDGDDGLLGVAVVP